MFTGYGTRAKASDEVDFFLPIAVHYPVGRPIGATSQGETLPKPQLFTPLKIKGTHFQNRLGVSPMCTYSAPSEGDSVGFATKFHEIHYGSFALRGAGFIIVEATAVRPEGRLSPEDLGIWSDEHARSLKPIVDFAHSQGTKIGIQLGHGGRKASGLPIPLHVSKGARKGEDQGWDTVGPSPISYDEEQFPAPHELSVDEIKEIVLSFKEAAKRAYDIAHFDFVEIHGAHGYLISEFLSGLSNTRTDAYGGVLENRARILLEIVDAVKDGEHPLFVRISASDLTDEPNAWTLEQASELALLLEDHGIDVLDVSDGGNYNKARRRPQGPASQAPLAKAIRDKLHSRGTQTPILVASVGGFHSGVVAEEKLQDKSADIILSGREFLINPGAAIRFGQDLGVKISSAWPYEWSYEYPALTQDQVTPVPEAQV